MAPPCASPCHWRENLIVKTISDGSASHLTLVPATEEDFEALVDIRIAAMRESLERLGRFNPERARERLRKTFDPACSRKIYLQHQLVGFYALREADGCAHLDHLYLIPSAQNRGIGSFAMKKIIAECDDRHLPIHVGALKESRSNRFYKSHGFIQRSDDEWDIYYVRPFAKHQYI